MSSSYSTAQCMIKRYADDSFKGKKIHL